MNSQRGLPGATVFKRRAARRHVRGHLISLLSLSQLFHTTLSVTRSLATIVLGGHKRWGLNGETTSAAAQQGSPLRMQALAITIGANHDDGSRVRLYGLRYAGPHNAGNGGRCFRCGRLGHWSRDCTHIAMVRTRPSHPHPPAHCPGAHPSIYLALGQQASSWSPSADVTGATLFLGW